jgi:hypothetical protein
VNNLNPSQYAHIGYWELWNEFYRSNTLQPGYKMTPMSWRGTYAELARMAQDMNCIITGRVQTITTNNNESCADVLASVGLSAPVDPSATIVSPSGMGTNALGGLTVLQNFLYCSNNPPKSAYCTTGSTGADAVDIINVHVYVEHEPIESTWQTNVSNLQTILQVQERGKSMMMGEGSFGDPLDEASNAFKDPQSQASFVARYGLMAWSLGISNMYWYAYDATLPTPGRGFGVLMVPDGKQGCEQPGGCITPAGTAWQQTYNWMVGATMSTPCSNQGTIWTCGLTRTNPSAYQAETIWNNSSKYYCSKEICPTHEVGMPTIYTQYRDLAGNTMQMQNNTAPVGSLPILLENQ